MATLYTCNAIESLEKLYKNVDGYVIYELQEGVLGCGLMVLTAPGYKTAIVSEQYMNEWSSAHKVRMYNRCPEKYAKMVYDKFGDILPGYHPKNETMSEYLSRKLLQQKSGVSARS